MSPPHPDPLQGAVMTELETQTQTQRRAPGPARSDGQTRQTRRRETRDEGRERGLAGPSERSVAGGRWPGLGKPVLAPASPASCLSSSPSLPLMGGHYHSAARPLECAVFSPHSWGAGARGGGLGGGSDCHGEVQERELGWPRTQDAGPRPRSALKDTG